MTPEQKARKIIDQKLTEAGWILQDMQRYNPTASQGVAVREYLTERGPADYILFVEGRPVGVIEAKREEEGHRLTVVEDQSVGYARSQLKWQVQQDNLPFIYESTGILTWFTDDRDPKPRSRPVFSFHRPETLREWLRQPNTLRSRLRALPELPEEGLRDCQITAIRNLDRSFAGNRPRALIQMATGSGKTFTAITSIYRLLKFAGASRVLFLVDTRNLGKQAEQGFMAYTPNDDNRKFTELYNVQRLQSAFISRDSQVCISTIQRMYSILREEELPEGAEETNPNEYQQKGKERPVVYNEKYPPEFFDFIVIDECHRSIYNLWKQVLEYFDAFLIGLTATPDKRTFGFFNENVVSEYPHERAVADGVNVGYDIYTIETKITSEGARLTAQQYVDLRHRLTRKQRWTQLDEDVEYAGRQLDKDIVNPSQIRHVIRAFQDRVLTEIFPQREEVPKTLIFAKTDSHADDIIRTVREEFGEGNDFCKKVTYRVEEDPESILQSFRNDYYPRIAVTVDMIATGTDVKPIECLLFMRDVKSRNYYEQMIGRGTRTLRKDDLRKVTPSASTNKTHFVIVDAVGVCKSVKTDSRPLERKKNVPLKDLMLNVIGGATDEDTFLSLANRLTRLEKQLDAPQRDRFRELSGGKSINRVVRDLLNAHDPDVIESQARELTATPAEEDLEEARQALAREAVTVFYSADLRDYVDNARRSYEQIIDKVNLDEVRFAGWDRQAAEQAQALVNDFQAYIEAHKDEITALRILYSQPHRRRGLTYQMIKELSEHIAAHKPTLAPERVWAAYEQLEKVQGRRPENQLTALVALIRRVAGLDEVLTPYDMTVNKNFQDWVFQKQAGPLKFSAEQMDWLRLIRDHIAASVSFSAEDLDYAPFDAKGGVGRMYQLFGTEMEAIIEEMNEELAA